MGNVLGNGTKMNSNESIPNATIPSDTSSTKTTINPDEAKKGAVTNSDIEPEEPQVVLTRKEALKRCFIESKKYELCILSNTKIFTFSEICKEESRAFENCILKYTGKKAFESLIPFEEGMKNMTKDAQSMIDNVMTRWRPSPPDQK